MPNLHPGPRLTPDHSFQGRVQDLNFKSPIKVLLAHVQRLPGMVHISASPRPHRNQRAEDSAGTLHRPHHRTGCAAHGAQFPTLAIHLECIPAAEWDLPCSAHSALQQGHNFVGRALYCTLERGIGKVRERLHTLCASEQCLQSPSSYPCTPDP